jgi:hypothetical protein
MTILPEALAGWAPFLSLFDESVVTALAPMLDRLARAIGPMAADDTGASDDPAGYDGVAKRGPYERLLPSEWLLAEEMPDEFLRRAATREHLFYEIARRRPRGRRTASVLIDVGPEVYGTPRIGALAALLVLAHRANAAGATFRWGLAQRVGEGFSDVGAEAVRALLGARAETGCSSGTWRSAVQSLTFRPGSGKAGDLLSTFRPGSGEAGGLPSGHVDEAGEVWLITGPHGAREAREPDGVSAAASGRGRNPLASIVDVEDVVEPEVRELAVRVQARGRPEVGLRLPLPLEDSCVRVLRDPFPRAPRAVLRKNAPAPLAIARPLISPGTAHVYARLTDGRLLVLPLPKSKRQDIGHGKKLEFEGSGEIVAAGHVKGNVPGFIVQHEHDLTLVAWGGKSGITRRFGRSDEPLRPPPLDGRLFPLVTDGDQAFFVDRGGRLFEFRPGNRARMVCGCSAIACVGRTIVVAEDMELHAWRSGKLTRQFAVASKEIELLAPTILGGLSVAHFHGDHDRWTAVALEPQTIEDLVQKADKQAAKVMELDSVRSGRCLLTTPPGAVVVGVLDHLEPVPPATAPNVRRVVSAPALLLLEEHGRALRVLSAGPAFSIRLPARAMHVVVDPRTRVVVCVTDTAELILVGLAWRGIHSRFTAEGRTA